MYENNPGKWYRCSQREGVYSNLAGHFDFYGRGVAPNPAGIHQPNAIFIPRWLLPDPGAWSQVVQIPLTVGTVPPGPFTTPEMVGKDIGRCVYQSNLPGGRVPVNQFDVPVTTGDSWVAGEYAFGPPWYSAVLDVRDEYDPYGTAYLTYGDLHEHFSGGNPPCGLCVNAPPLFFPPRGGPVYHQLYSMCYGIGTDMRCTTYNTHVHEPFLGIVNFYYALDCFALFTYDSSGQVIPCDPNIPDEPPGPPIIGPRLRVTPDSPPPPHVYWFPYPGPFLRGTWTGLASPAFGCNDGGGSYRLAFPNMSGQPSIPDIILEPAQVTYSPAFGCPEDGYEHQYVYVNRHDYNIYAAQYMTNTYDPSYGHMVPANLVRLRICDWRHYHYAGRPKLRISVAYLVPGHFQFHFDDYYPLQGNPPDTSPCGPPEYWVYRVNINGVFRTAVLTRES